MWCQGNFRFHRASNGRNVPDPLTGLEDALNVAHDMVLLLGRAACYITRTQRGQATPLTTDHASPPRVAQAVHGINVTKLFPA